MSILLYYEAVQTTFLLFYYLNCHITLICGQALIQQGYSTVNTTVLVLKRII